MVDTHRTALYTWTLLDIFLPNKEKVMRVGSQPGASCQSAEEELCYRRWNFVYGEKGALEPTRPPVRTDWLAGDG